VEGIGEILPRVVRRMGVQRQVRLARAQAAFSESCGEYLRDHVRVVAVEGSVLVVACAHPAIAHQMQMESVALLEAVNRAAGAPQLRRMRFVSEG
jgi:predicted nucleic acid-binding Zn ribbon protein